MSSAHNRVVARASTSIEAAPGSDTRRDRASPANRRRRFGAPERFVDGLRRSSHHCMNVSNNHVGNIERGKGLPSVGMLATIAQLLNLSIDALLVSRSERLTDQPSGIREMGGPLRWNRARAAPTRSATTQGFRAPSPVERGHETGEDEVQYVDTAG